LKIENFSIEGKWKYLYNPCWEIGNDLSMEIGVKKKKIKIAFKNSPFSWY